MLKIGQFVIKRVADKILILDEAAGSVGYCSVDQFRAFVATLFPEDF